MPTSSQLFEEPLDSVLAAVAAEIQRQGGPAFTTLEPAEARARIQAAMGACAPGPAGVRATDHEINADVHVRVYRDPHARQRGTTVHFHGGGWVTGDLDYADPLCRELAAATGRAVVSVAYRLAPEHRFPSALEDARAALDWVGSASAGLDADVLLSGDSAGGNLAAVCAAHLRGGGHGVSIIGQLLIYPVVDVDLDRPSYQAHSNLFLGKDQMRWFVSHYEPDPAKWTHESIAPLRAADHSGLPPTVVAVGGHDPLRDEGLAYAAALEAAEVPVETLSFPSLPHGFLQFTAVSPAAKSAQDAIAAAATRLWDTAAQHNTERQ